MPRQPHEKHAEKRKEQAGEGLVNEKERERGYYYDDAHGYETYDPEKEDEDSGGRPLDVDLDRTPPLLIESEEAKKES
jgi:hypothetical protein